MSIFYFFFQAEDGIRDKLVTGVQTCASSDLANILNITNSSVGNSASVRAPPVNAKNPTALSAGGVWETGSLVSAYLMTDRGGLSACVGQYALISALKAGSPGARTRSDEQLAIEPGQEGAHFGHTCPVAANYRALITGRIAHSAMHDVPPIAT